ncbi:MAG: hypothetical protein E6H07_11385 [Bacteroidetes bacterium]|nr:MAG: hypothetical protein E6H07_11385 [Bacteroidota bacterium]
MKIEIRKADRMLSYITRILTPVICIIFLQCSSQKNIQQPEDNSFEKQINKLQKNPRDEKTISSVSKQYKSLQQSHLVRLNEVPPATLTNKNEIIYEEYKALQQLYISIQSIPGLAITVKPVDYSEELNTAKENLAKTLISESENLLNNGDKASCRKSYYNLLKLQELRPGVPYLTDKLKESLQCALINIIIHEPVTDAKHSHYNTDIREFYKAILQNMQNQNTPVFISIGSESPDPDESIKLELTQFDIGIITKDNNSRDAVNNQPYTSGGRRSTTSGTGTTPASATITTTRTLSNSTGTLKMEIIGRNQNVIDKQEFAATYEWNSEINTYTGDRRALTANDRSQLRNPVKNPPTDNEIASILLKQLKEKILSYLQSRYAGF